jgi:integrase
LQHALRIEELQDSEEAARARLAISLAFWGALKPRELATLRVDDITVRNEQTYLTVPGRNASTRLPSEAERCIEEYERLRKERIKAAPPANPPLLSRLGSYQPIGAHSAWSMLRHWPPKDKQSSHKLGARALRETYLSMALATARNHKAMVDSQTNRASANHVHPEIDGAVYTEVCIDAVKLLMSAPQGADYDDS